MRSGWLAVVVALVGCSHERPLTELGKHVRKQVLVDLGPNVDDEYAILTPTTDGMVLHTETKGDIPLSDAKEIAALDRRRGAFEGLVIGLLLGATTGAIIGAAKGSDPPCTGDHCFFNATAKEKAVAGGFLLGGLGGLLGLIIGAARGSRDVYTISPDPQVLLIGPPGSTVGATVRF